MGKTYTQQLSELIVGLKYEDIPESVIEQVKKLTIHTIGAGLAAAPIKQAQTAFGMASRKDGTPEATIWGTGKKVPVEDAAYANAVSANVLEWEDRSWTGHPSAAVIPVALAYAEAKGLTGKEYIEVVVAAYEAYQRIAMAVQPSDERRAEFGSGLMSFQTFAASIAAVKAMGYDAEHVNQTFGATIYSTPIPNTLHLVSDQKSDLYHFAHGSVAHNGVIAAKLGNVGIEGGYDYLEGPHGYWKTITETPDDTWYVKDLGTRWLINEVLLRQWPATIWAQTPVALLDELVHEHPFAPEDVEKIRYSPVHAQLAGDYAASGKKLMDGQFNLSYVLAAYLYDQTPSAAWYSDATLNDEKVIALAW